MVKSKTSGRWAVRCASALSALALLGLERDAHALPLVTLWGSVRGLYGTPAGDEAAVGYLSGNGTQENKDLNGYGPGLGLAAGVTLPMSLYLGASFDYFFGDTVSFSNGPKASRTSSQLLARVGYDMGLGPLTLRPEIGLGALFSNVKTEGGPPESYNRDITANGTVLAPALEAFFGLGLLNINAEARYELVAGDNSNGLILGLGLGVSL